MHDIARINHAASQRHGLITNYGCGRIAIDNINRAFWQSRAGLRDAPELTDLRQLAMEIRK